MHTQIITTQYLIAIALFSIVGCNQQSTSTEVTELHVIAEGVIYTLEYRLEGGGTGGFTRLNTVAAVPGKNGSWNVDAYGRLMNDYLIITYPQKKALGPRAIPAHRLVNIQFGDGGIKDVNGNETHSTWQQRIQ